MQAVDRKKDTIICDLDGTIALDEARAERYLRKPHAEMCSSLLYGVPWNNPGCDCGWKRDWAGYFAACGEDKPNQTVINLLGYYWEDGYNIRILTGRSEVVRGITERWLREHAVPHHTLVMRPEDNRVDDHVWKPGMAIINGWVPEFVELVLEDRQRVVDAWRDRGYTCFQVAPGNF